jgi:hypothetical protein
VVLCLWIKGQYSLSKPEMFGPLKYDVKNWKVKLVWHLCIPEINKQIKQAYFNVMKGKMDREEYYENGVVTKSGKWRIIYWNNSLIKTKKVKLKNYFVQELISPTESIRKKHWLKSKMSFTY